MRIIKKYPNRRLYDTKTSKYITVSDVLKIIREGEDLQVVESDSGKDITRAVLVQIIIEQESGDSPIFTTDMLTKFIRVYDDAAQNVFGEILDRNLQMFSEQQKQFQQQMGAPMQFMQEMAERNLNIWKDMQNSFMDIATGGRTGSDNSSEK